MPGSSNDERQCAAGDAAACLSLGKSLLHADPAEPDFSLIISAIIEYQLEGGSVDDLDDDGGMAMILSRACQSGAGFSCAIIGFMHVMGKGAGQDYIRARQFFE